MCFKDSGPYFGSIRELAAQVEPFNEENSCASIARHSAYAIPIDEQGINELSGELNGYFTITELEVWLVTLKK